MQLTVSTIKLDRVGRQMDGDAVLVGLWELEILDLAVRAEHVHIQDCEWADNKEFGGTGEREEKRTLVIFMIQADLKARRQTVARIDAAALGLTFPHKPRRWHRWQDVLATETVNLCDSMLQ